MVLLVLQGIRLLVLPMVQLVPVQMLQLPQMVQGLPLQTRQHLLVMLGLPGVLVLEALHQPSSSSNEQ
jgi:hypothetical protein